MSDEKPSDVRQEARGGGGGGAEQVQLLSFSSLIQLAAIHLCCHGIPAARQ